MLLKVDLSNKKLSELPDEMPDNLGWLILDCNQFSALTIPTQLIHLQASRNRIGSVLPGKNPNACLRILDVSCNKLE